MAVSTRSRLQLALRAFNNATLSPLWIFFALVQVSCTNQELQLSLGSGDGITSSSPTGGTGASAGAVESGYFNLQRAIPSQSNPGASIDVVGDQQGTIGKFCAAAAGTNASGQNTGCQCQFRFTNQGRSESVEPAPTYTESDLLRCPLTSIPSGVSNVTIRIRLLAVNSYSSTLPLTDTGLFGGRIDLSSATQYLRVKRFQCRDHVYVPHLFDGNMYDPFQSESTRLSYPLNFYTSNFGSTFRAMIYGASQGMSSFLANWQCAINPHSQETWENRWVFSQAPLGGSVVIEDSRGTPTERSLYYLSKRSIGKFNVPVRAWIAPGIVSMTPDATNAATQNFPILGYAARPNADESCPIADVAIPAGYRWRKLWMFRSSLTPRRYVASATSISGIGEIACNPGSWEKVKINNTDVTCSKATAAGYIGNAAYSSIEDRNKCAIFKDCAYGTRPSELNPWMVGAMLCDTPADEDPLWATCRAMRKLTPSDYLAARVFSGKGDRAACFGLVNAVGIAAGGATAGGIYSTRAGTDRAARISYGNPSVSIPRDTLFDSFPSTGAPPVGQFTDSSNRISLSNYDGGVSRYDYLYVVSPPELRCSDFNFGGGANSAAQPYVPYTYRRREDCDSSNPTSNSICASQLENRNTFLLFSKEAGDSNAAAGEGCGSAYPLCVVQPANLGGGS